MTKNDAQEFNQEPQKRPKIKTSQLEHNQQATVTQLDLRNILKPLFLFQWTQEKLEPICGYGAKNDVRWSKNQIC